MRNARQSKILELIEDRVIATQEELAAALVESGFSVTQATVSRDIKELGLVKTGNNGGQRYVKDSGSSESFSSNFANIYKNAVLSIVTAQNLVVIKTVPGAASTVGMNVDRLDSERILGCVAGDDTVLVVTATCDSAEIVANELREML